MSVKVSIVMPVYNAEKYLRQCLDSVLGQTLEEIELICVDDGSSDNSMSILEEYRQRDSRLKIISQANAGAGASRNCGMGAASGEYLIFLDSDDFFETNMLESMFEKAHQFNADVCVCGGKAYSEITNKAEVNRGYLDMRYVPENEPFSSRDIPKKFFSFTSPAPWNKLFRREYLKKLGIKYQTLRRSNDVYFTYTALACAKTIVTVNEPFVYYRIDNPNSLQGTSTESIFDIYEALFALRNELKERGLYRTLERSFLNRALSSILYNLDRYKTKKAFVEMCDCSREEFFGELGFLDHGRKYFYSRNDFAQLAEIMLYPAEELWEKKYGSVEVIGSCPAAGLLDLDTWKNLAPKEFSGCKISVVVAFESNERFSRSLEAVCTQSLNQYEVILLCRKEEESLVASYLKDAPNSVGTSVLVCDELDLAQGMNEALKIAKGAYVWFFDGSVILHNRALEFAYSTAAANGLDVLVCGRVKPEEGLAYGNAPGKKLFTDLSLEANYDFTLGMEIVRKGFMADSGLSFNTGNVCAGDLYALQAVSIAKCARYEAVNLGEPCLEGDKNALANCEPLKTEEQSQEFGNAIGVVGLIKAMSHFASDYALTEDKLYFEALLFQLSRLCDKAQLSLLDCEGWRLMSLLYNENDDVRFDAYFYILNSLQLKQKLALAEADLRKTEKDCCVAKYELKLKQEELKRVRKSITYKAGRVLTKVPRSVKRMVKNK